MDKMLSDPIKQFMKWYEDAVQIGEPFADAMTLATSTVDGRPSVRTLLYKGLEEDGILFFSNYDSRKSQELKQNPHGALLFFWHRLYRQVRFEGTVSLVSRARSEAYFRTRPRDSQIGAWASQQSQDLAQADLLQQSVAQWGAKFAGQEVPCPPNWGGFVLQPERIEFWIGQDSRLHQRFLFERQGSQWNQRQLYP